MNKRIFTMVIIVVMMMGLLPAMNIAAADFVPRTTAPPTNSPYYYGTGNPFVAGGYPLGSIGNCTTYAWGRAWEILGSKPKLSTGEATKWWSYKDGYSRGSTPQLGAIAVWTNNGAGAGHVAVVERIEGNTVYISHSSVSKKIFCGPNDTSSLNTIKKVTDTGAKFDGYIYILPSTSTSTKPTAPSSAPTNLKANGYTTTGGATAAFSSGLGEPITITWSAVPGATKYKIEPMVWSGSSWVVSGSPKEVTTTSVVFNDLQINSHGWSFRVTAGNSAGWSTSNTRWFKVNIVQKAPSSAPTNLKANGYTTTGGATAAFSSGLGEPITLTWSAVSGANKYKIETMVWSGSSWVVSGSPKEVTTTSAVFDNLTINSHGWSFRVTAGNSAGWSTSNTRWFKVNIVQKPTLPEESPTPTQPTITEAPPTPTQPIITETPPIYTEAPPTPTPPIFTEEPPIPTFAPPQETTIIEIVIDSLVAKVNGTNVLLDQSAITLNGRTVVPARFIAENLGASVGWNERTETVTILHDDTVIEIVIDDPIAKVNGRSVLLDQSATVLNGRTVVPAHFIAESLGAAVDWNEQTRTVTITK